MNLWDCSKEIQCFVDFGGHALQILPRVVARIFEHFQIQPRHYLHVLNQAKVPPEVVAEMFKSRAPTVRTAIQAAELGTALAPSSTAPRRPRKRRSKISSRNSCVS